MNTIDTGKITVSFETEEGAKSWLTEVTAKASYLATISITVVKNTIEIIFKAAANSLLLLYGKFKDNLPYSLMRSVSYSPVR